MSYSPRHKDCPSCKFFNPNRPAAKCLPCGAGEFFEERVQDDEPTDDDLMTIFATMESDNEA